MTRPTVGRWSGRIVELAARALPVAQQDRYAREFVAELYGMSRSDQLRHALQVLAATPALRAALRAAGSPTPDQENLMTTTRRPWKCRLRLHRWDERENPETRELYEVCLRCDAYRERPRAYPGAGAAGMMGGGIS